MPLEEARDLERQLVDTDELVRNPQRHELLNRFCYMVMGVEVPSSDRYALMSRRRAGHVRMLGFAAPIGARASPAVRRPSRRRDRDGRTRRPSRLSNLVKSGACLPAGWVLRDET
jgi:hypothetical protein